MIIQHISIKKSAHKLLAAVFAVTVVHAEQRVNHKQDVLTPGRHFTKMKGHAQQ